MPADRLLHPVAVAAVAVLLLNDHVLKAVAPGWVTGKLSDVAGLIFFPLLLQAVWELRGGSRAVRRRPRMIAIVSCVTAIGFMVVKVLPPAHAAYEYGLGALQWMAVVLLNPFAADATGPWQVALVADPSDLLALPAVVVAIWVGSGTGSPRRLPRPTSRAAALLVLVFAAAGSVATTPEAPPVSSQAVELTQPFQLTAEAPVAILQLAVSLEDPGERSGLSAHLAATLGGVDEDDVRLAILPDQLGNPHIADIDPGSISTTDPDFFMYVRGYPEDASCQQLPCARTYRLVVEALDPIDRAIDGTVEVRGEVSVEGVEVFPKDVTLSVEAVGGVEALARAPVIEARSDVREATIGGEDRISSEVHAVVELSRGLLDPHPTWPVAPELVIHVDAADEASREAVAGQLVLNIAEPDGSAGDRDRWIIFSPRTLPFSVSLLPFAGCPDPEAPCDLAVNARLQAQSPGDLVSLTWWIEARVRYFPPAELPDGASLSITTLSAEDFQAAILAECEDDPYLVFGEALDRGLIPDAEVEATLNRIEAGAWDPTSLADYEELCTAAVEQWRSESDAPPSLTPSLADPSAPHASATFGPEEIALSAETPVVVREIRLTRSAEAAQPAGTIPIGFLRLTTHVPDSNPRAVVNAYISIDSLDGQEQLNRYDIPSSELAGPPLEIDPWRGCDPRVACEVELRITFLWWDYEPAEVHDVTWELVAGVAWPGLPDAPADAEVDLAVTRRLDTEGSHTAATERWTGSLELIRPGQVETESARFSITAQDWPAELANVQVPAYALLRAEASTANGDASALVGTDITPADGRADRGLGSAVELNGGRELQAFFPLRTCRGVVPCHSDYAFGFRAPDSLPDGPITIRWSIDFILRDFTTIDLPADTTLTIDVLP